MTNIFGDPLRTFAFEPLTVGNSPVGFTEATYNPDPSVGHPAAQATIKVGGASIRYRTDGIDPSATIGILAEDGEVVTVEGNSDVQAIRFVRVGGSDATLQVEYSR